VTAFLPLTAGVPSTGLKLGQPIECVVSMVNEAARTVTLRAHRVAVRDAVTRGSTLGFQAIHPGMLFHAIVEKVAEVLYIYIK